MATKVKTHKRKRKNGVSVVREHSRKGDPKKCDYSKCTTSQLKKAVDSGDEFSRKKAAKELKKRGE